MFTIKHIEANGYECIRTCKIVDFTPIGPDAKLATVHAWGPENSGKDTETGEEYPLNFQSGKVYVMNEQGATVASWDLYQMNKGTGLVHG